MDCAGSHWFSIYNYPGLRSPVCVRGDCTARNQKITKDQLAELKHWLDFSPSGQAIVLHRKIRQLCPELIASRELVPIPADEMCLCIDADCPNCGHPERITPLPGKGAGEIFGCRRCDYVSAGRES